NISRIQRLLKSGLSKAESPEQHLRELKKLVKEEVDEGEIKKQSKILKALSNPERLKIMKLLSARKVCVCEIMSALGLSQTTASYHLRVLRGAGLVKDEKRGKWVFYTISSPDALRLLEKIRMSAKIPIKR
ncbi:MAG: metalloregulator ArsR/SmtB family transcription factor, partial [Candidatus Bathyarchaeia archaeon]